MGTTANYSWPTPVATDLVKDGWEAIKDLGDAADTTVKAVSDAQGLVHINTTSFSAVASQAVNSVFSATYTNYKILFNINSISSTGTNVINMRLGTSGTPNTASDYSLKGMYVDGGGAATYILLDNATSGYIATCPSATTTEMTGVIDILNPFVGQYTYWSIMSTASRGYSNMRYNSFNGQFEATTSFTDFNIIPAANNITGSVSIYGYKA